ncbi:MAG: hypothetical protein KatS3mg059_1333 [Thermomicrobiales bacterium]|nr:MAG: hypothetical protein KatS3mg059_1333 [Thermomicrobiales bacterium]
MAAAWDWFIMILTPVVNVLDTVAFAGWLVAAYELWMRKREYQRRLGFVRAQQGGRPVAMAMGIGSSIRGQVEAYLRDAGKPMEIIEIVREGTLQPSGYPDVLQEIMDRKAELTSAGITELHFFYKGPVTLAAAAGAIFNNWVPVTAYNLCRDPVTGGNTYCADVVLCRETTVGVPRQPRRGAPGP